LYVSVYDDDPINVQERDVELKVQVRLGKMSISGPIGEDSVKAPEANIHNKIAGCYAAALRRNPNLAGTVTMAIGVSRRGGAFALGGGGLGDVVGCVVHQFASDPFPPAGENS
jgi:hypothetical protein